MFKNYRVFLYSNNFIPEICKYEKEYPSDSLILAFRNVVIQSIRIRSITLDDVPEQFRNPEPLIAGGLHKYSKAKYPLEQKKFIRAPQKLRDLSWSFEKEMQKDFKLFGNNLTWLPSVGQKKKGALCQISSQWNYAQVPEDTFLRPFMVESESSLVGERVDGNKNSVDWAADGKLAKRYKYKFTFPTIRIGKPFKMQSYFIGRYVVQVMNNKTLLSVSKYFRPYPRKHLYLVMRNTGVHSVRLQELELDQIPEKYRNPAELIRGKTPEKWSDQLINTK